MQCFANYSSKRRSNFEHRDKHSRRHRNCRCDDREDKLSNWIESQHVPWNLKIENCLKYHREQQISSQTEKYIRICCAPVIDNCCLFNGQIWFCPREIREQLADLFVCAQFAGDESTRSQWIRYRWNHQCHNAWIQKSTEETKTVFKCAHDYVFYRSLTFSAGNCSFSYWIAWTERICDATKRITLLRIPKQLCEIPILQIKKKTQNSIRFG